MKAWTEPAGRSEYVMHLLSVAFSAIGACLVWQMARRALLAATGIGRLTLRPRIAAMAAIAVVWGTAYVNYFTFSEYHNPIYAIPSRDIAAHVRSDVVDTLVVAESDTLVPYYFRSGSDESRLEEVTPGTSVTAVELRITTTAHPNRMVRP